MKLDPKYRGVSRRAARATESGTIEDGEVRAEVELSPDGHARRIRIFDGDREIRDQVIWADAEVRPDFWPESLPFVPGTNGMIWEQGAMWQRFGPGFEERARDFGDAAKRIWEETDATPFREAISAFTDRFAGNPGPDRTRAEEMKTALQEMMDRFGDELAPMKEKARGLFGGGVEGTFEEAADIVQAVLDGMRSAGWSVASESRESTKRSWRLERGDERCVVAQIAVPPFRANAGVTLTWGEG